MHAKLYSTEEKKNQVWKIHHKWFANIEISCIHNFTSNFNLNMIETIGFLFASLLKDSYFEAILKTHKMCFQIIFSLVC